MSRHRRKNQNLTENTSNHANRADRVLTGRLLQNNKKTLPSNSRHESPQQLLLFKAAADSTGDAATEHNAKDNPNSNDLRALRDLDLPANTRHSCASVPASANRNNLWLACTFPDIALDALNIDEILSDVENLSDIAIVVCDDHNRRSPIIACNKYALKQEISIGMPLGVAISSCHSLRTIPRNHTAEINYMKRLASDATRLSSQVSIEQNTLIIEIGGSLKLYGNLNSLLEHAETHIGSSANRFQMATATNPAAAALLSNYDDGIHITDPSQLTSTISILPLHCLSLSPAINKRLRGMGIDCLGDLLRLPRDGLARRAGIELIYYLDQLTGKRASPLRNYQKEMSFHQSSDIDNEMETLSAILAVAKPMLDRLAKALRRADASVNRIDWTLQHQNTEPTHIRIKLTEPARDSNYLFELSMNRLAQIQLPESVTDLSLSTSGYQINQPQSLSLFPATLEPAPDSTLIDRLRARLGNDSVKRLITIDEHRPEFASVYTDTTTVNAPTTTSTQKPNTSKNGDNRQSLPLRPLWLLPKPRKLLNENGLPVLDGPLRISSNQERIESGWWETHSVRRDYYIAIDVTQLRLWVFRDLNSPDDWYLHGIFG